MFILGLTGSIGMGKSATAKLFAEEGVPVHDADAVVHRLYEGEATPRSRRRFPAPQRTARSTATSSASACSAMPPRSRGWSKSCTRWWPQARDKFLARPSAAARRSRCWIFRCSTRPEATARCDAVVVVSAPADVQRKRAIERPGMTEEKLETIFAKQMPDAEKRRRADFVVDTSLGFDHARDQVRDILRAVATMPQRRR